MKLNPNSKKIALTLGELLVVMAIIAILIALVLPMLGSIRNSAKRAGCASNLRSIGNALALYSAEHDGWNPSGITPNPLTTWVTTLMPYMDWYVLANRRGDETRYCPATTVGNADIQYKRNATTWLTDYGLNSRVFVNDKWYRKTKQVELSPNVVMAFDGSQLSTWPSPAAFPRHKGHINVLFADGHVESLKEMPKDESQWGPALRVQ